MDMERKLAFLQNVYAASIAESVNLYQSFGQLATVVAKKEARQAQTAPYMIQQLGIGSVEDVFEQLTNLFGCANWKVEHAAETYHAVATTCKLCALAKKMGGASPCHGWCIDPMVAMINALVISQGKTATIRLESTLMEDTSCALAINVSQSGR